MTSLSSEFKIFVLSYLKVLRFIKAKFVAIVTNTFKNLSLNSNFKFDLYSEKLRSNL